MTEKDLEKIIERAAQRAATVTMNRLKDAGRISYYSKSSFRKTEELLQLYPKLPKSNRSRGRIEAALKTIRNDEYYGVIESRYFDGMTLEELAEIYDCQPKTIGKQKNRLVSKLAAELFPEIVLKEILEE